MRRRARTARAALVLLAFCLVGCAAQPPAGDGVSATMAGDAARPAAGRWLRTELYLAVGRADDPAGPRIDADGWRTFLDEELTPRFPDGFSVLDAYGQWRGRETDRIGRLDSKVIVILHPDSAEARERVEAVRRAFKARFGHDSVLRATAPVEVSF